MNWLGLDIGGANLKVANGSDFAASSTFAMWSQRDELTQELRTLMAEAGINDHLVVTMTGELADCFGSKEEGVNFILDAVEEAAAGRHTRVYLSDGKMVTPQIARRKPHLAASANWHALARFSTRYAPQETALLVDVGSTTTDLIPLVNDQVAAQGQTDLERLQAGELVYTGVERSPVCAVVRQVPFRGVSCQVAQEVFATMRDVYILLKDLPEDSANVQTADGKPATKACSRTRLGRMICADSESFNHRDAVAMAQHIADTQLELIAIQAKKVIARLPGPVSTVILSGHGEFLGKRLAVGKLRFGVEAQIGLGRL